MTASPTLQQFEQYAATYEPFPWEIARDETTPADMRGKHSVLISLVRFWKIVCAVNESCPDFKTIVDVGPYPGVFTKLLRHYFPQNYDYWGVGLGFTPEYLEEMRKLGANCFETELDPAFPNANAATEWPIRDADCALLLDVIEHLVDPIACLDQINRALRPGGVLILTTDNLTSFANTYQMLRRGHSPNIHPLRSSMFYRGPWRPHFREYTADELRFFLEHAGFTVVRHEYFERRQGDYYIGAGGKVVARDRYSGLKGNLQRAILSAAPHLRDHHLVVARKTVASEEVAARRPHPTENLDEWRALRARAGL